MTTESTAQATEQTQDSEQATQQEQTGQTQQADQGDRLDFRARRQAFLDKKEASPATEGATEGAKDDTEAKGAGEGAEGQEGATEAEKKPERFAPQFAALVKREGKLREQETRIKAERAEVDRDKAEYSDLKRLLSTDPIAALAKLGYTMSDLTKRILHGDAGPDPADLVKESETKLRKEFEEREAKAAAERDAQQAVLEQQRRLGQFASEVSEELEGGQYPLLKIEKRELVYQETLNLMTAEHKSKGVVLTYAEALARLEKQIREQLDARNAALGIKPADGKSKEPDRKATATLTNKQSQERGPDQPIDYKERRRRWLSGA